VYKSETLLRVFGIGGAQAHFLPNQLDILEAGVMGFGSSATTLLGRIFASVGVFLGHMLKNPYLDGVASVVIGLLLISVAFILAFQTKGIAS